jgi:hypothetical protein
MRGLLLSLTLFLLLSTQSKAEGPFNLGLKLGYNSSSLITQFDNIFESSEINHYLVGAFARIQIGRLHFQPEVYFNTKGGIFDTFNSIPENLLNHQELFSYQTIDIPLLLGFKLIDKSQFNFRLYGGPVLSYVTVEPIISDLTDLNIEELKDNFIGVQLGVGIDLWFITIDGRIENSFNIFVDNSNYSASNRVFLLSAGIKLF